MKKETGLGIWPPQFVGVTNDVFPEGKHHVTLWFSAQHTTGEPSLMEPEKATDIGWFSWNALPEPGFLPLQHLFAGESYPRFAMANRVTE